MRTVDVAAGADFLGQLVEVVVHTTRDVHRAVSGRVFDGVARGVGPAVRSPRAVHDAVAEAVYAGVGGSLSMLVRGGGRLAAFGRVDDAPAVTDSPRGAAVAAVVNGLWGDRLAEQGSALDLESGLRHHGADLPATPESLAAAYPDATPRLALFIHGLCESETAWWLRARTWHPDAPPTHGHRLRRDLGHTPVWARYNTGRRISVSGRDLDLVLDALQASWPVSVDEIVLVGHSMGGLVARSAVDQGRARGAVWADRVAHVVCLGSPHHGAPLEKAVNVGAWALDRFGESRPFADILNGRSVGVKDLRYGNVSDDDWRDHDPDALLADTRVQSSLVDGVRYHVVGATIGHGPIGGLVGDGIVRLGSATGRHHHRPLSFDTTVELGEPVHHLALLNHPAVYEHLRTVLGPPAAA